MKFWIVTFMSMFVLFSSCDSTGFNFEPILSQFTEDDLGYLIYDNDSLYLVDDDIVFLDTIDYLYNDTLLVSVPVITKISSTPNEFSLFGGFEISGSSRYRFENCPGFNSASSIIHRFGEYGGADLFYEIWSKTASWQESSYSTDTTLKKDTATVLGVLYNDVYKFRISSGDRNIKTVFFAKKYGYIKIATHDGYSVQRIRK